VKHSLPLRLAAAALGLMASLAQADPGYYLITPYGEAGEAALDLRYWTVNPDHASPTLWPEVGLRYGVNERWTTELLASFIGPKLSNQAISSWNWQNSVMLTEGESPLDAALHAQLIHNAGEGNVLALGPVLQTYWGSTQLNLNLLFERSWANNKGTQFKYQWQALHRFAPGWRAGVQGFGEMGRWMHWATNPSHRGGPVARFALADHVDLQAAYLVGQTYGRDGHMLSAQLLVEF